MNKTEIVLLILVILPVIHNDCLIAEYPRKTSVGNIRAEIQEQSSKQYTYDYPLAQALDNEFEPRSMVAVNGLGLHYVSDQIGYGITILYPTGQRDKIRFKVEFSGEKHNHGGSAWKNIQFSFLCTQSPHLIAGNLPLQNLSVNTLQNSISVSTKIAIVSQKIQYKNSITQVFLSRIKYNHVQKGTQSGWESYITNLEMSMKKLERLQKFSWNLELLKRFTKVLKDQRYPGISIKNPTFEIREGSSSPYRKNSNGLLIPGSQKLGTLSFEIFTTPKMELIQLSYSYLIYLEKANSQNIYWHLNGRFEGYHEGSHYFTPLGKEGMMILGLTAINIAVSQQELSLDVTIGESSTSTRKFYYLSISDPQSSFSFNYFAIQTVPALVCSDCAGNNIIFDYFCVSRCPDNYVMQVNQDGAYECKKCEIEKFLSPNHQKTECICPLNSYQSTSNGLCSMCPYDCATCNGNSCLTCESQWQTTYRTLNPRTGRCECPKSNFYGVGLFDDVTNKLRVCQVCNPRCLTCRDGSINGCLTCSTQENRKFINGFCGCLPNFVEQTYYDQVACVCKWPYRLNQLNKCILESQACPESEMFITNGCQCQTGFMRNPVTNICLRPCLPSEEFIHETGKCKCKTGYAYNQIKKVCQLCSLNPHQFYDEGSRSCRCMKGMEMDSNRTCIECGKNKVYSIETSKCECIFNYYYDLGSRECRKCTAYSSNNSCEILIKKGYDY